MRGCASAAGCSLSKADLETACQAELVELQRVHACHVARIEAQLRDLDRGFMPQPLREDDLAD